MGKRLIAFIVCVVVLSMTAQAKDITIGSSFDKRVDSALTGGTVSTKTHPLWELTKYRDTVLLTKAPMAWCGFSGYLAVQQHVKVDVRNNQSALIIDTNLKALLGEEAEYNKRFASDYPVTGKTVKEKIRQIYKYCKATVYTAHTKTARDVFSKRQGDCSGIASAFYVLCKANGIPVKYVIGWTKTGCHAWNRVQWSKRWWWIDACYGNWMCEQQFYGRKVMEMW